MFNGILNGVAMGLVRTEWKNKNKQYIETLRTVISILESEDVGKEHAIKKILQSLHGDDRRARVVNEFVDEIKSRFTLEEMVVLIDSFERKHMCPEWLWG